MQPYGICHVAVNGKEALDAFHLGHLSGEPYQLICLDIMMPEMDGQAVLKALRGEEEARGILSSDGVKIIMTTALNDMTNIFAAYRSLCDGYMVKPISRAKLLEQVREFGLIA